MDQTGFTYPGIRVFYHDHAKASSLSEPLPLLVFVHGLGGSVLQYHSLLARLTSNAPCLAIDLPGCGRSVFAPHDWAAYSPKALMLLLCTIIETYRNSTRRQKIVLIGHSYGCMLVASMASKHIPGFPDLAESICCAVALCSKGKSLSAKEITMFRRLLYIPTLIFDCLRMLDRRGGLNSSSVTRATGFDADLQTKQMQMVYNEQSRTPTFRRIAYGLLPESANLGDPGQLWCDVSVPCLIIAGEEDKLATPDEASMIVDVVNKGSQARDPDVRPIAEKDVLPAPAGHTLLFSPATVPTVSGLIRSFLTVHIDERLSGAWQLMHLSSTSAPEHKWEMKNLEKWQRMQPVSDVIAGTFRAMKTMRQGDDTHCPNGFGNDWRESVGVVIDISHETPSYNPQQLEDGGIRYQKYATVSKQTPSDSEVEGFIAAVDRLRGDFSSDEHDRSQKKQIAVHCHYGFNRTGYLIVCYLVERMGWRLQDAVNEFARARPPGIKHGYFVDTLFVRYYTRLQSEDSSAQR